ncbi:MAG TPA: HEAT repeat domain-containing protein [Blastocatellia bacterium]|nr:HEAT repeat domain-containing protein [Blastocatellia bacterium]
MTGNFLQTITVIPALALVLAVFPLDGLAQNFDKLNRFMQKVSASDSAMKLIQQGRNQIDQAQWDEAAQSFNRFIAEYPRHKDVDVALYWLAYTLKNQRRYQETNQKLEQLIREYPRSSWIKDARALQAEIAPQIGRDPGADLNAGDEEIKLIALQSLFQSSPERATAMVAEILKPGSKYSRKMKENAIALLGQHRGEQVTPILIELARNETDPRMRKTAIFWLGQSRDESTLDVLKDIAVKSADKDIGSQAAFAISQHRSPRATALLAELARTAASPSVRHQAIFGLSQRHDETAVDELLKLFDTEQDPENRKQIFFSLSQTRNPKAQQKILDLARSASDISIRKQAIFALSQQHNEQTTDLLIQMYDSEKDEKVKDQILSAFSHQHSNKKIMQKLMDIARKDSSLERRKQAIFWLGQIKDPEATRFLEEILK